MRRQYGESRASQCGWAGPHDIIPAPIWGLPVDFSAHKCCFVGNQFDLSSLAPAPRIPQWLRNDPLFILEVAIHWLPLGDGHVSPSVDFYSQILEIYLVLLIGSCCPNFFMFLVALREYLHDWRNSPLSRALRTGFDWERPSPAHLARESGFLFLALLDAQSFFFLSFSGAQNLLLSLISDYVSSISGPREARWKQAPQVHIQRVHLLASGPRATVAVSPPSVSSLTEWLRPPRQVWPL